MASDTLDTTPDFPDSPSERIAYSVQSHQHTRSRAAHVTSFHHRAVGSTVLHFTTVYITRLHSITVHNNCLRTIMAHLYYPHSSKDHLILSALDQDSLDTPRPPNASLSSSWVWCLMGTHRHAMHI
jgi:hypothetical protein